MRITTKENDIESILYSEKQIAAMVETLGEKLTEDYAGKRPVMVCVLKGASVFFTDLCREIDLNLDMDFISVSSYGMSSKSSGVVKLNKDVDIDITGRDVILVDDIIDSGVTPKDFSVSMAFSTTGRSLSLPMIIPTFFIAASQIIKRFPEKLAEINTFPF